MLGSSCGSPYDMPSGLRGKALNGHIIQGNTDSITFPQTDPGNRKQIRDQRKQFYQGQSARKLPMDLTAQISSPDAVRGS